MKNTLTIKNLHVSVEGKPILQGISLEIKSGEIHALMGPNGSGKSTLSYVLAGHPKYKVESGEIWYGNTNILALKPEERAKRGLFLAFQYPVELPGVNYQNALYTMTKARRNLPPKEFQAELKQCLEKLNLDPSFIQRHVNVGFSGGEKKKAEVLQLLLSKPSLAILDETDSGLDRDALEIVGKAIQELRNKDFSSLIITHYPKLLRYLNPDKVHIIMNGRIILTGDNATIQKIEQEGYAWCGDE
ncbi:Fe-S cluster assembly ATPase SufC [Candidatus Woesearchaeota archaeon]|nr:Fe-S cluster assembly ATPase SufC [Candidatus Woesearchaeota archaeon]